MDREAFEAEVLALAGSGRVTVADVSARSGLTERTCETLLARMVRDGRLDRDGDEAAPAYRAPARERARGSERPAPRRSEPPADEARSGLGEIERDVHGEVIAAAGKLVVAQAGERIQAAIGMAHNDRRSLGIAALAGLLLGPLGLFYAAPWATAIVATAVYLGLRWLPFWPTEGAWRFWLVVHALFGFASFLYAVRFNRTGERSPLLPPRPKKSSGPRGP